MTTICKKIGISVSSANKWLRMDEDAFETYLRNNTPYLEQYRAFILSILKIRPQMPATNIMYRIKDQFPDFDCKKNTFFRYVKALREQTGYIKPENRPTSFREETPPGYEAQVGFGQFKMKDMYDRKWLDTFTEQTMQSDTLTTVDGTTMKMLVDRIHVRNDGIVVEFKCGVTIEQEYVK